MTIIFSDLCQNRELIKIPNILHRFNIAMYLDLTLIFYTNIEKNKNEKNRKEGY